MDLSVVRPVLDDPFHVQSRLGRGDHALPVRLARRGVCGAAAEARTRLRDITCRWGDPQEIGALRFLIDCIIQDDHNRQAAIRTAAYGFGLNEEHVKFFYNWAIYALRTAFYDKVYIPFTEQDLIRAAYSYTILPDLIDLIGFENTKKVIAIYGGGRPRIPSLAALADLKRNYQMYREMHSADQDPDSMNTIARKYRRNQRTATEIFSEMVGALDPRRSGEHELYDHDSEPNPFEPNWEYSEPPATIGESSPNWILIESSPLATQFVSALRARISFFLHK